MNVLCFLRVAGVDIVWGSPPPPAPPPPPRLRLRFTRLTELAVLPAVLQEDRWPRKAPKQVLPWI